MGVEVGIERLASIDLPMNLESPVPKITRARPGTIWWRGQCDAQEGCEPIARPPGQAADEQREHSEPEESPTRNATTDDQHHQALDAEVAHARFSASNIAERCQGVARPHATAAASVSTNAWSVHAVALRCAV